MNKNLADMSLEELWQLFPIFLTPHRPCWKDWYDEEAERLQKALPQLERISHIGSTAVPTIWAKPIIDILLEVPQYADFDLVQEQIEQCGYLCMSQTASRRSFNKGYTENGFVERVFHLHPCHQGDHDELYFRDYLLDHADIAKAYETLKLQLWKKYEHDRDGYTAAKSDFISLFTAKAKYEYKGRYE